MIAKTRPMTVEEYFAFDEASDFRNEYIDGELYPMTGGTRKHGLLISYTISVLIDLLADNECEIYPSVMRVMIDETRYVYPDVGVICGKPRFEDENEVTLLNPTVVVEVTSPSSYVRDHTTKLDLYGAVASIEGYLILDQERVFAEWYTRADSGWHLRQFSDLADVIPLAPLGADLLLAQIYGRVGLNR